MTASVRPDGERQEQNTVWLWISAWMTVASAGDPTVVLAMGDGLVAGPPAAVAPEVAAAWVTSLADCLDERATDAYSVTDRATPGETVKTARAKVGQLRKEPADVVVVTLGAQELADDQAQAEQLAGQLETLLTEMRAPKQPTPVILVGMVPPTLAQAGPDDGERQSAIDARTEAWNAEVAKLARRLPGVRHLDVWQDWPRDGARQAHTEKGWHLSEQGHARVAAAVCDAVVALKAPPRKR